MKRVLISAEWFPPAFKAGGPVQSVSNLASVLAANGMEVWVIAGNTDLGSNQPLVDDVNVWIPHQGASGLIHVRYSNDLSIERWRALLEELKPEVVHLNSLYSARYSLFPLYILRNKRHIRVLLAPRGMLGASALSIKRGKKRLFLMFARWFGLFNGVRWHASTPDERAEVLIQFRRAEVDVAQNLTLLSPMERGNRPRDHWSVIVVGRIHSVKNLEFGLNALAAIEVNQPIRVKFIGPAEDESLLIQLKNISEASSNVQVEFLGGLPPAQLQPHYQSAHYLLSPTTQENFGHSIVEALAHGCPVLISDRTPWRNLTEKGIGWDWPLDMEVWKAGLTEALSKSPEEWERMSDAASRYFSTEVRSAEAERANLALFEL